MFRKTNIFFIIVITLALMFLFSQLIFATEIDIIPVLEGQEYYIMKVGEVETFTAYGFGWDEQTQQRTSDTVQIKEIHWSFDSRFLELIETKDHSIILKAIKARTSRLTVTGIIDGETVSKTIFIVIESAGRR